MSTVEAQREPDDLGFDPDALREKYRSERDKRLRADGNDQYLELTGELAHYLDDPTPQRPAERPALTDHVDMAIVGGGFSGLLAGARSREAGLDRIRIVETGGDVGGTWWWNKYPGVQCDIESYIYLPLLEQLGTMPSEKYAHGPEIQAHTRAIAEHYDLYDDALFHTRVSELRWDEDNAVWTVHTNRGDAFTARFVCLAIGPLSRPKLPGIPGITSYEGHSFHTSRWDYDYTGGDTHGNLHKLHDRSVGIIGTGATAVQCVPHLAEAAEHLYVFQRTPSSVDERRNRPTDPAWVESLEPGWQEERIANFSIIVAGGQQDEDLVDDGWTDIIRNLSRPGAVANHGGEMTAEGIAVFLEIADFHKMEAIRNRIADIVDDPATAEALKPYYRQFCKRPCFHDEYLPSFNRANVTLVDTEGQGVERITPRGVVAGGHEYELDCIIYSTGFEVGTDFVRRAGFDLVGRAGLTLVEKWGHEVATFHGLVSRGFPNCFFMGGVQSGVSPNFTELYNEQSQHLGYLLAQALESGARTIEPTADAETQWVELLQETATGREAFQHDCTPGYYNNEGRPGEGPGWFGGNYNGAAEDFFAVLRQWREAGELEGMELA